MNHSLRVAACHAAPVFLSAKATTDKAVALISQAAKTKANLVVFPETFIPAFPVWSALRPPTENHDLFKRMALESIYVDGEEMKAIQTRARKLGIMVSLGFSEKAHHSSATLFNSNVIVGTDGEILVHHRKLMPTFFEKLTWSPGDGFGLRLAETKFGRIGNLICGENTNPLARFALMAQGEQVHISTWPGLWATRAVRPDKNDAPKGRNEQGASSVARGANYDNVAANRIRSSAHCFEAKCFGVVCSGYLASDAMELITEGASNPKLVSTTLRESQRGVTMFLDPAGAALPGFVVNPDSSREWKEFLQNEEGILYADLDLNDCIEGKQYHDVVGGYQRLDVFDLKDDPNVQLQYKEIVDTLAFEKTGGRSVGFVGSVRTKPNWRRLLLALSIPPLAMITGFNIVTYYFGSMLGQAGVTNSTTQVQINVILSAWQLVVAVTGSTLAERLGRRVLALASLGTCSMFFYLLAGLTAKYGSSDNKSGSYSAIACIFLFLAMYAPEVLSYNMRATGIAMQGILIKSCGVFVTMVFSFLFSSIGWRTYIVNASWNILIWLYVYFQWVETRGSTLEEVDVIFDGEVHVVDGLTLNGKVEETIDTLQLPSAKDEHLEKTL